MADTRTTPPARPGDLIGYRRDGRPIHLAAGGADDDGSDQTGGDDRPDDSGAGAGDQRREGADTGAGPDGEDKLDDAGKRALERERERRRAALAKVDQLEAELADLKTKQLPDDERKLEEVRRQAREEALAEANRRLVRATVRGLAAGKLADPDDAWRFLELDKVEVNAGGEVDEAELTRQLEELVKARPYLAAVKRAAAGAGDGGARKSAPAPEPSPGIGRLRAAYAANTKKRT